MNPNAHRVVDPDDDKTKAKLDDEEKARRWLKVIDTYDREFKKWSDRCEKIIKIYTEKRRTDGTEVRRMSLLWSNISVLQPAIYAKLPQPNVTRRFKDDDPVARTASEMVERAVQYTFDDTDFDGVMRGVRDDYLLVDVERLGFAMTPSLARLWGTTSRSTKPAPR
jgi:hypothetical protein